MTPKQKAIELFDKYFFPHYVWENDGYQIDEKLTYEVRKRFALIAVNELIKSVSDVNSWYWEEVKEEIEKL